MDILNIANMPEAVGMEEGLALADQGVKSSSHRPTYPSRVLAICAGSERGS